MTVNSVIEGKDVKDVKKQKVTWADVVRTNEVQKVKKGKEVK